MNILELDLSEISERNITKEEALQILKNLEEIKKEVVEAFVRYYFVCYVGKNILLKYNNGEQKCVICRGTKFYIYSENSPYVDPEIIQCDQLAQRLLQNDTIELLEGIQERKELTNEEATLFLRNLYSKRAERSKELFNHLVSNK